MAIFNAKASDKAAIRHDAGSLFGGYNLRYDNDEVYILKATESGSYKYIDADEEEDGDPLWDRVVITDLMLTNVKDNLRVVYTGEIAIRPRWDGLGQNNPGVDDLGHTFFTPFGESWSNDYKLDWGTSRFSSIELQLKSSNLEADENAVWISHVILASNSDTLDLPQREQAWNAYQVGDARDAAAAKLSRFDWSNGNLVSNEKGAVFRGNFDLEFTYQSLVYNTQYPFGTPTAQQLFGNDVIVGSRLNDYLHGYAGDDKIQGGFGHDILVGDYGADQLFGQAGNDVLILGGSSSSWDVSNRDFRNGSVELAAGGSGHDIFVFRPSQINWMNQGNQVYRDTLLPNLYNGNRSTGKMDETSVHYNPFMSQNQEVALLYTQTTYDSKSKKDITIDRGNGVSNLTQRVRVEDFQIGTDILDLSAFGLTKEFLLDKSLLGKNGTSYLKAISDLMSKTEGMTLNAAKTPWTSGNTSIFIKEDNKVDSNDNGTKNDTLLEIQLVGINISSLNGRFFGEWNEAAWAEENDFSLI